MIQPSRNLEFLINNIEKDILGEDNIGVTGKDKKITRRTFLSLFLPV